MYGNEAHATSPQAPQDPATGAGGEANTPHAGHQAAGMPPELPMAVVVMVITKDRITQHAHLHLGGFHPTTRNFVRTGPNSWRSKDPEFIAHEQRIGIELAEFADGLPFPDRVANMLPCAPANPSSDARQVAATAVEALRHG